MNTTFFNQIAELNIEGNLQINIQKTAENTQIVSVLYWLKWVVLYFGTYYAMD